MGFVSLEGSKTSIVRITLSQYPRDKHEMTIKTTIPTIDISPWLSSNASQKALDDIVKEVHDACSTYGFFNLIGHGVSAGTQKRVWEASKLFFDLPLEEKMEVSVNKSMGKAFRGYEPSLIQTHQVGLLPDTKEVRTSHTQPSTKLSSYVS